MDPVLAVDAAVTALNSILALIVQLRDAGVSNDEILAAAIRQTSANSALYKTIVAHLGV